jgi:hypothetical protein
MGEYKMKQTKKFSALAAGIVTMGLLLGASAAQAYTLDVIDGNVLQINNLELNMDNDVNDGIYDVEFINDVGRNVYSEDTFPFNPAEEAGVADIQVNNALNCIDATGPCEIPTGASSAGTDDYSIPAIEWFGFWGTFSGEYFELVGGWDACETDCLSGINIISPNSIATFATFTRVSEIPVPAAVWLFGSGLLGLIGIARRKQATSV